MSLIEMYMRFNVTVKDIPYHGYEYKLLPSKYTGAVNADCSKCANQTTFADAKESSVYHMCSTYTRKSLKDRTECDDSCIKQFVLPAPQRLAM